MNIGVIFIATGFKVRMKWQNKTFLKQDEKQKMKGMLDEIELWIEKSDRQISPVVITPFDEIYEIAVSRRFKVAKNAFAESSEGSMIRFGIKNFPDYDAYLILSASDITLFKAEIFEFLAGVFEENTQKVVLSKYNEKLRLPLLFSRKNMDLVNSMLYLEKGKSVFRTSSEVAVHAEITQDIIERDHYRTVEEDKAGPDTENNKKEVKVAGFEDFKKSNREKVVLIRGGGRIAAGAAAILHRFGYSLIITETNDPQTIFRENTFSKVVRDTKCILDGIRAYLVTPDMENFEKAWEEGVIPVIIDPELEVLDILKSDKSRGGPFEEKNKKFDPLEKYRQENPSGEEDESGEEPEKKYSLVAICDFSSPNSGKKVFFEDAKYTFGTYEDHKYQSGPEYLIRTRYGLNFSKIIKNSPFKVSRIDGYQEEKVLENKKEDKAATEDVKEKAQSGQQGYEPYVIILSPEEGKYSPVRKIGETVRPGEAIGEIDGISGKSVIIKSETHGRIIGSVADGKLCTQNSRIAAISKENIKKDECSELFFGDSAIGVAVLSVLSGYFAEEKNEDNAI